MIGDPMAFERISMPQPATLQGVGDALRRAIPIVHDPEERAERHELRKIDLHEALRR